MPVKPPPYLGVFILPPDVQEEPLYSKLDVLGTPLPPATKPAVSVPAPLLLKKPAVGVAPPPDQDDPLYSSVAVVPPGAAGVVLVPEAATAAV